MRVSGSTMPSQVDVHVGDSQSSFGYVPNNEQMSSSVYEDIILENLSEAAEAGEGSTLGSVAKMFLRVTAGVVGMPLYGIMLGSTALLSACLIIPGVILGLPFAAIGACIGATFMESEGDVSGAWMGAVMGLIIGGIPIFLVEGVSYLPKAFLCFTVGAIGAGLTSYALYGTLDDVGESESKTGYSDLMTNLKATSFALVRMYFGTLD
jgi:hypothetical protein